MHIVSNTLLAFATPIHQRRYPSLESFNAELKSKVLAIKDRSPGVKVSNVGGWHSETDLLQQLGDPHGSRLAHMFVECVKAAFESMVEPCGAFPRRALDGGVGQRQPEGRHQHQPHPSRQPVERRLLRGDRCERRSGRRTRVHRPGAPVP